MSILIVPHFSAYTHSLRNTYDRDFEHPERGHPRRFQWDYWHLPNQYTLVRTPADRYFEKKQVMGVYQELLNWGRKNLGCFGVTPAWLSFYVDGCRQNIHADLPHGPWAYVWSLTNWNKKKFTGGETFISKPASLQYFANDLSGKNVEKNELFETVPAHFNQLLVFDPRLPHGVNEVRGTQDPREARVVIHGWFTEPQPYFDGHFTKKSFIPVQRYYHDLEALSLALGEFTGSASVIIKLKKGKILNVKTVIWSVFSRANDFAAEKKLKTAAVKLAKQNLWHGTGEITLPLRWESK